VVQTSEQQNEFCGGLCWLNQRCGVILAGENEGLGSWTRFFFLIHFVLISSRGEVLFLPICGEEE